MYQCVIIIPRIPAHSFRRISFCCLSLCGEESSFPSSSPAGSTEGLHIQKLAKPNIHQDQTMRSGVGLYVLGLLCLYSSVLGQETVEVRPGILIFCDDPAVQKAVTSAVHKFNERLTTGHKLAFYQILSASKSENSSGSVYSLKFTSRRSDCQVSSKKPWTDCDYLPIGRKRPLSCNATVYMTDTETDTEQVDCLLDDYIFPEKASCLGCPEDIDTNSEDIKVPLSASISKYNSISESTHLFTLHSIGQATRQVVAGFRFKLRFDVKKTTCAKSEHKDLNELCVPDEENAEFFNCNSTVDVAPWRLEAPDAELQCEQGALPTILTRRRPPGWSPLRNVIFDRPATGPSQPSPPPVKVSTKEESSEEDTSASKASKAVNDDPFHCPSKPWKPFNPVHTGAAPTKATAELASPKPSVEGALSDTDLVGQK
ncbi:kininogen-1 isoform X2 [Thunnus albacares]|uniref:kininogen-1 isoform X2 n=1 Tax=Thunnus albacares TaxID=8236 RepID=UPI001CF64168|nr:kininogen-1 isoform X2 [Thunnus albacares]